MAWTDTFAILAQLKCVLCFLSKLPYESDVYRIEPIRCMTVYDV